MAGIRACLRAGTISTLLDKADGGFLVFPDIRIVGATGKFSGLRIPAPFGPFLGSSYLRTVMTSGRAICCLTQPSQSGRFGAQFSSQDLSRGS
jgi:hypothetical protein